MKLSRRQFGSLGAGLAGSALFAPGLVQAADPYADGKDYVTLEQHAPVAAPPGKVEVVEFFWYGCGHCNAFEPMLEAWVKKLPADVFFHRVPVAFREKPFKVHQQLYYALEQLGVVDALQAKVFYAIHNDHAKLDTPQDCEAFAARQGLDVAKFRDAFNSFSVNTKLGQAQQLVDAYKIDGVPALGIHGRYYTAGSLAGDHVRALQVADWLIARVRKAGLK